jgi:hypothetical protein
LRGSIGGRGRRRAAPPRPCPTITSARPGSRPAASHAGQHGGRTAAHEGGPAAHNLTSIAQCTIRRLLRVLSKVPRSTAGNGALTLSPPLHFRRPCAGAPASGPVSTIRPLTPRETDARRWASSPAPAQAHHAARAISSIDPSTTPRGNTYSACSPRPQHRLRLGVQQAGRH